MTFNWSAAQPVLDWLADVGAVKLSLIGVAALLSLLVLWRSLRRRRRNRAAVEQAEQQVLEKETAIGVEPADMPPVYIEEATWFDRMLSLVAVGLILAFSSEGMWEVATGSLNLSNKLAVVLFAVGEIAMVLQGRRAETAKRHEQRQAELLAAGRTVVNPIEPGTWRRHAQAVWRIAAGMGVIVSLASDSLVEVPIRLGLPLLAAYLWWLQMDDTGVKPKPKYKWKWNLRRILLGLDLAEPEGKDVEEVDHAQRVEELSRVMLRLRLLPTGDENDKAVKKVAGRRRRLLRRLQTLTLTAAPEMVDEAAKAAQRAFVIEAATAPLTAEELDRVEVAERRAADAVAESAKQQAAAAAAIAEAQQRAETAEQVLPNEIDRRIADERHRWQQQRDQEVRAMQAELDQVATRRDQEVRALRSELASVRQQLAAAPGAGAIDAAVSAVRAELDQVAAQRTDAQRAAEQRGREVQQLQAALEAMKAELAESRRGGRLTAERAAELAAELASGVQLDTAKVSERYGVEDRQARRLLTAAKKLVDEQKGELATAGGR
ncbi:hypothetical protein F8271_10365 [Micromonospora sp. ALFpr18c]|uniref:hypothetical protein n=1 Tax=Micromonospora sp. ALFpr18c TaxID=1458665 RepID=UPI00124B4998|nr:hypothetical protein [Micromonospora sp. ALFpr18c]KAB1943164.1 hypothetical protein F8271_10365 [Micromonospora sp. ALFpr18c]